jgi:hypothetical protein
MSAAPALGQDAPLVLFGDQPARGLWRMEITEASDPKVLQSMAQVGAPSLCLDPSQSGRPPTPGTPALQCTTKTLQNTRALSETEQICADGRVTRVTLTRESAKVLRFATVESGGKRPPLTLTGRYSYQGPCAEGQTAGSVQVDKSSAMCAELRAQTGGMTLEGSCGQIPDEAARAACIQQMEPLFKQLKACD